MIRLLCLSIVAITVGVSGGALMAQPDAANQSNPKDLQSRVRNAHTPEDFRALANYYAQLEARYLARATGERREWERRSQSTAALDQKYPRPVDAARNRYEYFMTMAAEMRGIKEKYRAKAGAASSRSLE